MTSRPQQVAVVGAAGPTGAYLVRELANRGRRVVAVSRPGRALYGEWEEGGGAERWTVPYLEAATLTEAVQGCHLVAHCVDMDRDELERYPRTAWEVAEAARLVGARSLHVAGYGSFAAAEATAWGKDGGTHWRSLRAQVSRMLLEFGACVVQLPDFFGPHVHSGVVQDALREAAAGEPLHWILPANTPVVASYLPDAMRIVADLADRDAAYGADWAMPGSGVLIARRVARLAARHLGRSVRLGGPPSWAVQLMAVQTGVFGARPLLDKQLAAFSYDTSKIRQFLGEPALTPYEVAIPRTLDWLLAAGAGGGP